MKDNSASSNTAAKYAWTKWAREEHEAFLSTLEKDGKDWKKLTAAVGTRTREQIKSYATKLIKDFK